MLEEFVSGKLALKILISKIFQLVLAMFILKMLVLRILVSEVHVPIILVSVMFAQGLVSVLVVLA